MEIFGFCIVFFVNIPSIFGYSPIQKNCGEGEVAGDWFCYSYHHEVTPLSWHDASDKCSQINASLTSIGQEADWDVLFANMPKEYSNKKMWIGIHQDSSNSGLWQWVDGTKYKFAKWDSVSEESISVPAAGCKAGYMLSNTGMYFSDDCTALHDGYICKTKRIRVFEMGEPWTVYNDPTNPGDRRPPARSYLLEALLFEPPTDEHILTNANVLDVLSVYNDVQCGHRCMKNNMCIYAQAFCVNPECTLLECTLKGAIP